MQEIKKKQRAKSGKNKGQTRTITKLVPKHSFFHYFSEPREEEDEDEEDETGEEPVGFDAETGTCAAAAALCVCVCVCVCKQV